MLEKIVKKRALNLIFTLILSMSVTLSTVTTVEAKSKTDKTEKVTKEQKKRLQEETKKSLKKYSVKDDTSKKLKKWQFENKKTWKVTTKSKKHKEIISEFKWNGKEKETPELIGLTVNKTDVLKKEAKKSKEAKKKQDDISATIEKNYTDLANLEYDGEQTIDVNGGVPYFTDKDLSLKKKAWETYGDLDSLNRATVANAMLNKSLMPTEKRGDISKVKPTGWKNKEIKGGYLFNRSHLIGFALSGENDNWKNLITGTRQLNSPEMLRHEMDVKEYLERSKDNYVRYRITPIFRGDELLARGVQMEAQSIKDKDIKFNVYIFNIQDGVTLNYADGSSTVSENFISDAEKEEIAKQKQIEAEKQAAELEAAKQQELEAQQAQEQQNQQNNTGEAQFVDENGNGLIKGSNNGIYHTPGSTYYSRTTNPAAWFSTISEAEAAGYRAPKR